MNLINIVSTSSKAMRVYAKFCQPVCKKYDLTQTGFDILLFFANNPTYNTARDVCRIRGIKTGIASVTMEKLILAGYLSRENDSRDRRIQRLRLTDSADAVIQEGRRAQREFGEAISQGLTREEAETFLRLSAVMAQNVEKLSAMCGERKND